MKIEEARRAYDHFSGKTSEIVRQLALGGIAIIWIFTLRSANGTRITPPVDMIWAGLALLIALAFDLLHYVIGAAIWGTYSQRMEDQGLEELAPSRKINWAPLFFYWGKILAMVVAYILLGFALADRLSVK